MSKFISSYLSATVVDFLLDCHVSDCIDFLLLLAPYALPGVGGKIAYPCANLV